MTSFIPKISKLSERVMRVLGCNPGLMTLQGTNTYIIGKGERRVLLDTGDGRKSEYIDLLNKTLKENDFKIKAILISHWHPDHINGVNAVLRMLNESDCEVLKFRFDHEDKSVRDKLTYIKDGHEIKLEDTTLRIHHTPGHSSDHIIVTLKEENSLFSGDCILGEGSAVFEDLVLYMNSLRKILELKPDLIYPGHGPVINNPIEKIEEYIFRREEREQHIINALPNKQEDALPIEEIVKLIYRDTSLDLHGPAAYNVHNHLVKLMHENKADMVNVDGEDRYWFTGRSD